MRRVCALAGTAALSISLAIAGTSAQQQNKNQHKEVDGQIRAASMRYYSAHVFGRLDEYLQVARLPVLIIKDGALRQQDEAASRQLFAKLAAGGNAAKLTDEERRKLVGRMIEVFDEASVQFVGANTAELTFLMRAGEKAEDGDRLGTFVLTRSNGGWRVFAEITDSTAVPPSYLFEGAKP